MANTHGRVAAFNPHFERILNVIRYGAEKDAISLFSNDQYSVNLEVEYVFEDRMMYKITPLNWAVRFNKPTLCKYLLDHGARPFNNLVYEYFPLHEACCRGFDKIVSIFIELKCDLNKTTPTDRDTPLHIACVRGNVGCVHLLLSANANPNLRNAAGHTPLEAAVYNSQDDLVKLFAAYGISTNPAIVNNSVPAGLPHSSVTSHSSHVLLQRRHSLSSTSAHSAVQRVLATVRPQSRPNSVLLSDSQPNADCRPPSRITMATQMSCIVSPPTANTSPLKSKDSFSSHVRTTAPSISPLTITQGDSGFTDSLRPTYISQLSVASASSANSPSPVERDCGLQKNWTNESQNQNPKTQASHGSCFSVPSTFATPDPLIEVPTAVSTEQQAPTNPFAYNSTSNCGQYNRLTDTLYACKTSPGAETSSTVKMTPALRAHSQLSNHRRPQRKLKGIHHTTSLDGCGELVKSAPYTSFPSSDFPRTTTTQAYSDMSKPSSDSFKKTLSLHQNLAPVETLTSSPSRERINSLASCITDSLETLFLGDGREPSVAQKLSGKVAQMVDITPEELHSFVELALSQPPIVKSFCPPDLLSGIPHLSTGSADHPAEALREVGLCIEDHPREVRMCDPLPGHMSVSFKMHSNQTTRYDKETSRSDKQRNEMLKVIVQVFNLRNPVESSLYHSIGSEQLLYTEQNGRHLNEVFILQQLSIAPHPNVAHLMSHFKADVSNQYDRFAQQARLNNQEELYVTKREADFIVLSMPSKSLQRYFDDLKSPLYYRLSEKKVLAILAQVLLAAAHLNRNGFSHNAVHPGNIFIDTEHQDNLVLSNFGSAVCLDNLSREDISCLQQKLRTESVESNSFCRVAPEVKEALQSKSSVLIDGDLPSLFQTSDSYAAAQMIYELMLGPTHKFMQELGVSCYSYDHIPLISGLSSLSNHLLKTLFAYEAGSRMSPLEGAASCLVLLFGPHPTKVNSVQDCKEWLLAETVELYLKPFLKDTTNLDYVDSLTKLLCVYLTMGNANPELVWRACRFFQEYLN